MANFNVEGAQNVEISKKIPCEKPLIVQLEIMERYTAVHKACAALPKEIREVECLKVLYPTLFRKITNQDLIAGRTDFLPIGFGCVTSLGGVGHYCVFKKLRAFQLQLDETERKRVMRYMIMVGSRFKDPIQQGGPHRGYIGYVHRLRVPDDRYRTSIRYDAGLPETIG